MVNNYKNLIMGKCKILITNIRGIRDYKKRRDYFYYLRTNSIDIAMLQETHSDENCKVVWNNQWGRRI